MPPAARMGDNILQQTPHCHGPHPPAGNPLAHPGLPLAIIGATVPNVMIMGAPAAVVGSMSAPCVLPGCVPGGPGTVSQGSPKVKIQGRPAARVNDMTTHATCVAPIGAPKGTIIGPGAPTVMIN